MISNFSELLKAAEDQQEPQRLLFLFAKAEKTKKKKNKSHQKGTITPVMCVDKLPSEITDFDSFVVEADSISKEWDFMLTAGLNGKDGVAPTTEEAEPYLNQMTNQLASGQDISQFVIFDREENPIDIMSN
ncbi:MAG: hypothetical protein KUG73_06055 [Pseudomonadales bacterium]|nr:hypothetical protein [Pseudomonadales bacterium]